MIERCLGGCGGLVLLAEVFVSRTVVLTTFAEVLVTRAGAFVIGSSLREVTLLQVILKTVSEASTTMSPENRHEHRWSYSLSSTTKQSNPATIIETPPIMSA